MSSKGIAAIGFVTAAAVAAGVGYYTYTRSPQYSLKRAAQAVSEHDLVAFQQYVDTERVVGRFIDDMMASATDDIKKDDNPFGGLATGMLMMMRPQLVKGVQEAVERAIETGRFESDEKKSGPAKSVKDYWRPATETESGYRGVAYVKKQGKIALAGLEIFDADTAKPFVIELKLRDLGDHWQVVELSNMRQVQKDMQEATRKRLEEINAPIRAQMGNAVKFEDIRGYPVSDFYGVDRKSVVSVQVRNTSVKPISGVRFKVMFTGNGELFGEFVCGDAISSVLLPGESRTGTWSRSANPFISSEVKLFTAIAGATPSVEIQEVDFADGTALKLQSELKSRVETKS